MRIKGIPGHEKCSDTGCEGGPFSCMSTDEVYTSPMTNEKPWWDEFILDEYIGHGVRRGDVEILLMAHQKRILEKAIERLEWKKNDYMTFVEKGTDGILKLDLALMQKYYRRGIDEAITELKSLMGEV